MTVYGVTDAGFVLKPFSVIRSEVEDDQRQNISAGLNFSDQSVITQINVSLCNQHAEAWELGQAIYASQYPDTASAFSLVQVCALTGTVQNAWTKTRVLGQVTLNPNKSLPAGSVAHLSDRPSSRFVTLEEVPADPSGGDFDVLFEAEEPGPIDVTPGLLNTIAEPVSGWTAVTNNAAGLPGSAPETDDELRAKRERELSISGSANLEAVRSAVSAVDTVVDIVAEENVTEYWADGMRPKSLRVTVRGGADADIRQAIFDNRSAGIDTNGETVGTVEDSEGTEQIIRFRRAEALDFFASFTVEMVENYTAADVTAIKAAAAAYINSLGIGDDVQFDRVLCGAYSVPALRAVTQLRIGFSDPPLGVTDLVVNSTRYALADVANIEVTVSAP